MNIYILELFQAIGYLLFPGQYLQIDDMLLKTTYANKNLKPCAFITAVFYCSLIFLFNISQVAAQENSAPRVTTRLYFSPSSQSMILRENGKNKLFIKDYLGSTRVFSAAAQTFYPYGGGIGDASLIVDTDKGF